MTVTDDLLACSPLPPLEGAQGTAERLVLLVHRGVDWDVWGGARRVRYWDALADRVRAATYAGPSLADWWQAVSAQISSAPQSAPERAEMAALLATAEPRAVLVVLRSHAPALVLRTRVLSEARSVARKAKEAAAVNADATDAINSEEAF